MNLIEDIVADQERLQELRRDIHQHPELAYEEHRTADLVARELESYGLEVARGLGQTGVVGTLRAGSGGNRAIGLRADMDALAMEELNTFGHVSTTPGKMHGCGHDGHTVMLLGAARHLARNPGFNGTVHFIFQPAEEGQAGADAMIKDGLFEQFPVETVWGMHNYPTLPVGHFATRAGPFMACSDRVEVKVNGVGGHGAMPHFARSPVNTACTIIQSIDQLLAQEINTQYPCTFTVGRIHGGDAINVIPDSIEFAGTMRTFSNANRDLFESALHRIIDGVCASQGISADVQYNRNYPPLVNTKEETEVARRAAAKIVGEDNVNAAAERLMGSEDFSFMLEKRPGNYIMVGNGVGEKGGCMVHNPHYDFNDEILAIGASYWVELTRELLLDQPGA
ncbi:MAG: M20 aminoacylase family protein [Pseudomonadota bacterium]